MLVSKRGLALAAFLVGSVPAILVQANSGGVKGESAKIVEPSTLLQQPAGQSVQRLSALSVKLKPRVLTTTADVTAEQSGKFGDCQWVIYSDGTLTLDGGTLGQGSFWEKSGMVTDSNAPNYRMISKIVFLSSVQANEDSAGLFSGFIDVTKIENLKLLDTSRVTNMSSMFEWCASLTKLDLSHFNTSKVTDMNNMFYSCLGMTSYDFSNFDTRNVKDMSWMFYNCSGLVTLDLRPFDTRSVTNMSSMFYQKGEVYGTLQSIYFDKDKFDTSNVTDMSNMFYCCAQLKNLDTSFFNTSRVTNMGAMFYACDSLKTLNLSNFDTAQVTDMTAMFWGCIGLNTVNVSSFDTSHVTSMRGMFEYNEELLSLDITNFRTGSLEDMSEMFEYSGKLSEIDVSKFDTSNVKKMDNAFGSMASLKGLDLSTFNTDKLESIAGLVAYDPKIEWIDLSSFDTRNMRGSQRVFTDDTMLKQIRLGSNTLLNGDKEVGLPAISTDSGRYTGKWIGKDTGKTYDSSDQLMADYNGDSPDTYVWEGYPAKTVTVKYEDHNGKALHASKVITGYAQDDYDTTTDEYKLKISGYTLDTESLPANAKGNLSADVSQEVIYKYNQTKAAPVMVVYQDSTGKKIHDAKIITGYVNDDYDVSTADYQLSIPGYDLDRDQLPDNLTGKLSDTAKTITYSYKRAESAGVTVSYQDLDGKTLRADQQLTGKIGDRFDVTTADYQLAIEGYRLDKEKLPTNMTGELTDKEQTVIYQYQKLPATAQPVTVKYVDLAQKQLHADQQITGKVGDHYDASTSQYQLVIDGYELDTSQLPGNLKGAFGEAAQTVTYVYRPKIDPIPTPSKGVLVRYVDGHNRDLQAAKTLSGKIGDAYDVSTAEYRAEISGYELDTSNLPVNQKGKFTEQLQTVTYVYQPKSTLPVQAGLVTVKYVDPDGKTVHADQTISGLVGKAYDASTTDYQLVIEGYKLDQAKLPTNRKGILSNQAQTVTYVYQKQSVTVPSEPQQPATTKPKDKVPAKPVAKTTTKVKPDQAADDAVTSQNSVAKKSATKALPTAATQQVNRTNRKLPRTSEQHQVTKRAGFIGLLSLLLLMSGSYYWRQR